MRSTDAHVVRRGTFIGAILRICGFRYRGAKSTGTGVALLGRSQREIPFGEFAAPTRTKVVLGFSTITFFFTGGSTAKVAGVTPEEAAKFSSEVDAEWFSYLARQVEAVEEELQSISKAVSRLVRPRRYPSACLLEPFYRRASKALEALPETLPDGVLSSKEQRDLFEIARAFHRTPSRARDAGIKAFMDSV